ncbi:MAG: aspartate--tRNA ligase [Clostridiales bacterium]|nr:aspartate--tRNA ligase [Clostridiales bacterium]
MPESISKCRTHYCAQVDEGLTGREVTVMGWVSKRRDLGGLIFITLRDRTGIVQAIAAETNPELFKKAETVRGEYVLAISGQVRDRTPENVNPAMKTGKIEIDISELKILSEAEVPPFSIMDEGVGMDLRLKYRYLDLRRPALQQNIIIRHKIAQATREFLNQEGFYEIETPFLTKSTPEGARDYLVPSRVYPGSFYALPQSPQIFKQLLMLSGFDRYYQLARCFRDEDLRADRQPEFTQIDMELSFVTADDIIAVNEGLMKFIMHKALDLEIETPFPRLTYTEAMERFGSDKPDLRFGMELSDLSAIVTPCEFVVFQNALETGGSVRGINARGCAGMPRKQVDALSELAKTHKAKGLASIAITGDGALKTSLSKFFTEEQLRAITGALEGKPGDLLLICADRDEVVFNALGALRVELGKRLGLLKSGYKFVWITEFPLLEWSEEDGRFYAKHHPFTAPMEEDLPLLSSDPALVRAQAYDLVLNGVELGGGSIRISSRELQQRMFAVLGFTQEAANEQFGFLMEAYRYGAPPHGGLAFGLDRIAMLLTGAESLREVIAFPKVKDASCPMSGAPSDPAPRQLEELGLIINNKERIQQ